MNWYCVDESFMNYLRKHETRIPFVNYGNDKLKPFFGSLFEVDNLVYVTQVSSPKKRHNSMKNQIDFIKILNKNNQLISVVNLNFMFPVCKDLLIPFINTTRI